MLKVCIGNQTGEGRRVAAFQIHTGGWGHGAGDDATERVRDFIIHVGQQSGTLCGRPT